MKKTVKKKKEVLVITVLAVLLAALCLVSFALGRYPVSLKKLFGIIFSVFGTTEKSWDDRDIVIILNLRLPRILAACMVGGCLSAAGACFQGIFRNPMASPEILGASKGAAFGAALAIILGLGKAAVTLSAFLFSLLSIAAVFFFGRKVRGNALFGLILAGIMIGSLFDAGTSFIKLAADPTDQLPAITYWMIGSLSGVSMKDISFAAVPMLIGIIPLLLLRWKMNLLTMEDEEALSAGVNIKQLRLAVLFCATLITAASVAVSGVISWAGLVMPHLMRRLVGSNNRYLIPACIFGGALFLLATDNLSRTLLSTEIPIGILTAVVGVPFFLFLLSARRDSR